MPLNRVQIANMALSLLGAADKIESFTEASVEAEEVSIWYDYSLKSVLELNDWSFASKRATLNVHGDDPPTDAWGYRYQYPADCVRMRRIWNPSGNSYDAVEYEIEMSDDGTKSILTDMEDAIGIYTFLQTGEHFYSATFVKLLAHVLAGEMCMGLTGKMGLKDRIEGKLPGLLLAATADDANERVKDKPRDAEWIRFRGAGSSIDTGSDWESYPDAAN